MFQGAFASGKPVQPCLIRYHNRRFYPAYLTAGPNMARVLVRVMCEPINWYLVSSLVYIHILCMVFLLSFVTYLL